MAPAEYVDTFTLSHRLGLAIVTLEQYRSRGKGPPYIRIGRSVRYHWPTVEAWLAARTVVSLVACRS